MKNLRKLAESSAAARIAKDCLVDEDLAWVLNEFGVKEEPREKKDSSRLTDLGDPAPLHEKKTLIF